MIDELELELERYELFAGPSYHFFLNRRQFLKAFSGGINPVSIGRMPARSL